MLTQKKSPRNAFFVKNVTNLNLYNFENEESVDCPYILTSPRSLKACNLANIKPVELIQRSAADLANDFNVPVESAETIYANYEQERLRKLEICRLVRRHILQSCEGPAYPANKVATIISPSIFVNRDSTSRSSHYTRDTPECSSSRGNPVLSSYSTPTTPVLRCTSLRKQNKSIRCSLSSSSSSISSLTTTFRDKCQLRRSKSADNKKNTSVNLKKVNKKNSSTKKFKSAKNKLEANKSYQLSDSEQINDRELCWKIDNVKNSATDFLPKRALEKSKIKSAKGSADMKKAVKNKRNIDEQNFIKNCEKALIPKVDTQKIRKNRQNSKLNQQKSKLEESEEKNGKKINDNYNENVKSNPAIMVKDQQLTNRRKQSDVSDGMQGLNDHDLRILDAMALKKELQQSQDNLAQKARAVWAAPLNPVYSTPISSANKMLNSQNLAKIENSNECAYQSENITFETYFNHVRNKMKQLKEDSLNKELHGEHVRQLARELQAGMEQWQDQILLLQWRAVQRARTNAILHIENKRLKTQCENNERALLHALRFKNVQNMEKLRESNMKKEIEEKDKKIQILKVKREREIQDCRAQAHYTAELREQLRRTLTPETFDQKANDVVIKSRFINRSLTASPFVESHIRLG